jgi:phosphoribosylformimino-5-aminoimidazole carboxamide ribotide isomerase
VDLEATEKGTLVHRDLVIKLAASVAIPVQVGGGIRQVDHVVDYLENGIDKVVLGSLALKDFEALKSLVKRYPKRIVVALDVESERVMTHGWQVSSEQSLWDVIKQMEPLNDVALLITDIQTDGMLSGPNIRLYDKIKNISSHPVIASGGVTTCEDIQRLSAFGVEEAVLGKAMYEGILPLKEAIKCSQKESSLASM